VLTFVETKLLPSSYNDISQTTNTLRSRPLSLRIRRPATWDSIPGPVLKKIKEELDGKG
jgi:hypothetical protein